MGSQCKVRFKVKKPYYADITVSRLVTEQGKRVEKRAKYIPREANMNNRGLTEDIIFTGNQVATRVYLNEGNFKFSDISST